MLSSCVKPDSRTRTTLGRCRFSIWLLPNPILALEICIFDETRFSLLYFANPLLQIIFFVFSERSLPQIFPGPFSGDAPIELQLIILWQTGVCWKFVFYWKKFLLLVLSATVQSAPPEFPPLPFLISGFQLGNCTSGWVAQMWDKNVFWGGGLS